MAKGSSVFMLVFVPLVNVWLLIIDFFLDLVLGKTITGGSREERKEAEKYEKSAHLVDIVMKAKAYMAKATSLNNFVYKHNRYVHPEYILRHKNVTLMGIEKDRALFAVSDPTDCVYDTAISPYFNSRQFTIVKQLVVLPIRSFHKLAESIGDPKFPVAIVAMTARCGSTLLVQMFSKVPGTRVLSEPNATVGIHEMRTQNKISPKESKALLKSALRLTCKCEPNSGVERVFVKLGTRQGIQLEDIQELFPEFKYFFNTRHPLPTLKSSLRGLKLFTEFLFVRLGMLMFMSETKNVKVTYREDLPHNKIFNDLILSHPTKKEKDVETIVLGNYTQAILSCLINKKVYGDRIVLYEDLIRDPECVTKSMFDAMDIPHKYIPAALDAMKRDSKQGGSFSTSKDMPLDQEFLDRFDFLMKELGVPMRHDMSEEEFRNVFKG